MYLHILFYIKQNSLEYPKFQLLVYYYENVLEEYTCGVNFSLWPIFFVRSPCRELVQRRVEAGAAHPALHR